MIKLQTTTPMTSELWWVVKELPCKYLLYTRQGNYAAPMSLNEAAIWDVLGKVPSYLLLSLISPSLTSFVPT